MSITIEELQLKIESKRRSLETAPEDVIKKIEKNIRKMARKVGTMKVMVPSHENMIGENNATKN